MAGDGSALVLSFKDGLNGNAAVAQSLQLAAFWSGQRSFRQSLHLGEFCCGGKHLFIRSVVCLNGGPFDGRLVMS